MHHLQTQEQFLQTTELLLKFRIQFLTNHFSWLMRGEEVKIGDEK
jgi:hypothetical protein